MSEKVIDIAEVTELRLANTGVYSGSKRAGVAHMIRALCGYGEYDGYKIETTEHVYHILIANEQNCCETWGYFTSEDDFNKFIGEELVSVELTDTALNRKKFEVSDYYEDNGGIQFVDFKFANGAVLQFAVYNAHNGYYGHPIIMAKDDNIFHQDTL